MCVFLSVGLMGSELSSTVLSSVGKNATLSYFFIYISITLFV